MSDKDVFQLTDYNKSKPVPALFADAYSNVVEVAKEHPILTTTAAVGLTAGAILITRGRFKSASSLLVKSAPAEAKSAVAALPAAEALLTEAKMATTSIAPTLGAVATEAKPLAPILTAAATDAKVAAPILQDAKLLSGIHDVKPLGLADATKRSLLPISNYQQSGYRWIPPRGISCGVQLSHEVTLGSQSKSLVVPLTEISAADAKALRTGAPLSSDLTRLTSPVDSWKTATYKWIPPRGAPPATVPEVKPLVSPHEARLSELGTKVVPMNQYQQTGYRWIPPRGTPPATVPEVKPLVSPHEAGLSELGTKVVPMNQYQQAGYRWIPPRGTPPATVPEVKPLVSPHEAGLSELGTKVVPMNQYQQAGYRWIPPRGISGGVRLSQDVTLGAQDGTALTRSATLSADGKVLPVPDQATVNLMRKILGLPPI